MKRFVGLFIGLLIVGIGWYWINQYHQEQYLTEVIFFMKKTTYSLSD